MHSCSSAGSGARRALDLELDRQARAREPADEARQSGAFLARPQHAEQPAHLLERLAAGLGDLRQRAAAASGSLGRGVAAAVGLGDHHRQRVRDDVVQLARDPRPLLRRPELRLLVALDLERGQARAAADAPVGEQRRHQHLGADGAARRPARQPPRAGWAALEGSSVTSRRRSDAEGARGSRASQTTSSRTR